MSARLIALIASLAVCVSDVLSLKAKLRAPHVNGQLARSLMGSLNVDADNAGQKQDAVENQT